VAYAAHVSLTRWLSRRVFVWSFPWRSLVNAAVASGAMGIAVHLTADQIQLTPVAVLALCAGLGSAIYAVVLVALGEVSPQERARVRRAMHEVLATARRGRRTAVVAEESRTKEVA